MNKDTIIKSLKLLYKLLPLIISALGGATVAATVSGCKFGSMISIVSPAI